MISAATPLGAAADAPAASSLYIHIPFCFHKCHYCDFYSIVDTRDRQESFTNRLCREISALAARSPRGPLRTVFVGGGTPTLLRVELWERLLACLRNRFDLASSTTGSDPAGALEFTVECNPETASAELMSCLAAGGVNRLSVGAQSFNPLHLETLERWHDPENVLRAIELARAAGIARQSLDLIFAIPGQTLDDWREDLRCALQIGTTHISCYNLTYEPNTAMTARLERGAFAPACDEVEAEMYETTLSTLRAAGLERYEVSNYARPGDEARHNLAYWRQEQWLAAGPSASAHIAGHRWKNTPRLDDYLSFDDEGFAPIVDHEPPDPERALVERIMTGLRLAEGVPVDELKSRARGEAAEQLHRVANRWVASGHMLDSDARWRLTDAGFLIADTIVADLAAAIE